MVSRKLLLFHNGTLILPDRTVEDGYILCEDGRIRDVGHGPPGRMPPDVERVDAGGGYIGPGYVDLHIHGGDGADFMDGTPEAVRTATRAHARHGTTTIFPTTTTGSPAQIEAMLDACESVRRSWQPSDGARIAGVHFYGPYFAESKVM